MPHLDEQGLSLLELLVNHLDIVRTGRPETYLTYKKVHDALGLHQVGPTYGLSLQSQGLDSLAVWTQQLGLPAITGLIVSQESFLPGDGYFKLLGVTPDSFPRWTSEIERAKTFDWSPYRAVPVASAQPVIPMQSELPVGPHAIWRLIAHHAESKASLEEMEQRNVIAVGWSDIGDLAMLAPVDSAAIGSRIREIYPDLNNSAMGGPSLWNLYEEMKAGDLVIVIGGGAQLVFEVVGDYFYAEEDHQVHGYRHQRAAVVTPLDPAELWDAVDRRADDGQNLRWTLKRCKSGAAAERAVFIEGTRFEVRSTAVERNPKARAACIAHYGPKCAACDFEFAATYGELGEGFIHVHHRRDISLSNGSYAIDPIEHLIPLCPNCHSMVHRQRPAMSAEALRELITNQYKQKQQVTDPEEGSEAR